RAFVEQAHELQAFGLVRFQHSAQEVKGLGRVQNVFHHQDVNSLDAHVQVFRDPHFSRRLRAVPIARDAQEVDGNVVEVEVANQIRQKDPSSFEDAHQPEGLATIVGGDLRAYLANSLGDHSSRNEYFDIWSGLGIS